MTIKDIAERACRYGLVCQKFVPFLRFFSSRYIDYLSIAYPLPHKLLQLIYGHTKLAVINSRINLYS